MIKKQIYFISCILAVLLTACTSKPSGYTISGKNLDALNGKTYFLLTETNGTGVEQEIDSFTVENGKFSVTGNVESPLLLSIKGDFSDDGRSIFLENTTYTFTGTDGTLANATLETDSKINDQLQSVVAFEDSIEVLKAPILEQYYSLGEGDTQAIDSLTVEVEKLSDKVLAHKKSFIESNPASALSAYLLYKIASEGNVAALKEGLVKLDASLKSNPYVVNMQSKADALARVEVGQIAPDFSINDLDGNAIKLSDYRGKYVLLDFWASWCMPCRKEFPHLLEAYKKFAGNNFDILGISLDDNRDEFATSLEEEKLPWKNASELKRVNQEITALYAISFIPKNFLIDPNGKIVAVDLRGDEGMAQLNEILSASAQ